MKLLIFGGTRGVGLAIAKHALNDNTPDAFTHNGGHDVTIFARPGSPVALEHPRLSVCRGDVMDPDTVGRAVAGQDAVVVALGAPALSKTSVRSKGTAHVVAAMEAHGVRRLVAVSVLGLGDSAGNLSAFLKYVVFPTYLRRPARDHAAQEACIAASGLDWTVIRPPHLNDGPMTGAYRHGFGPDAQGLSLHVSRADVAHLALSELAESRYLRRAVGIAS